MHLLEIKNSEFWKSK